MISQICSRRARENAAQPHLVFRNDKLLIEILIRLLILFIHLFTTVSKQWLRILISSDFTLRRRKIPNLDPLVDDIGSTEFTIYEMMKGSSVWSVRYLVNTEELMNSLPEG
ncbi:hypothetical protein Tco_1032335 [Tanacetum coccineum]|uniref:Uncharacterized protein n=1 Tax=Tanacetum coccineum TaxID=301880 RepID=A0ABQ5GCD1_9ASTR